MRDLVANVNAWRDTLNPLRGLTIQRAVTLLESAQRGALADLQWTFEFVEQTDPDLVTLVERRTAAIGEMDYFIKLADAKTKGFDQALADDQAEALREAYTRIDNLYDAFDHFELAAFRGFSIAQPHTDAAGEINHLELLDHWNFARDGRQGAWYWNPEAQNMAGKNLPPANRLADDEIMVHQVRRPIDRIGLVKFIRANMSEKDWDAFIEIYGLPAWIIIEPPNVPPDKTAEFRTAADRIAQGGGGALPNGSVATPADGPRGIQPFNPRLQWLTEKLIQVGTGGLLTVLAQSGSGTLAGSAHMEAFKMIARARAAKISEFLQLAIDKRVLGQAFAGKPVLAYFDLAAEEEKDVGAIVTQVAALSQWFELDAADVAERTGYKVIGPRMQAPAFGGAGQIRSENRIHHGGTEQVKSRNRAGAARDLGERKMLQLLANGEEALAKAQAGDFKPITDVLVQALNSADDGQMDAAIAALQGLKRDLPKIYAQILNRSETATVIENSLTAAFFNGTATAAVKRGSGAEGSRAENAKAEEVGTQRGRA